MIEPQSREIISRVMSRYGASCSPEEFHAAVNVTFHNFESEVYDQLHSDMWTSLPQQFALLVDDCIREHRGLPEKIRVLDVGAGTGLASDCLLRTALGPRITSIDLIDTSQSMLEQATRRASRWNVPVRPHAGLIGGVPEGDRYELIVTCSVLHHVPDLKEFCSQVRRHQLPGGIFLHLQDPNTEFMAKRKLETGGRTQTRLLQQLARFTPKRIGGRIARELAGTQGEDYISKTNRALIQSGVVTAPLRIEDLFSITDIHVLDERGISIDAMRQWLPDYECLSQRSYVFFGKLRSELPARMQAKEDELCREKASGGAEIAAVWCLRAAEQ